MRRPRLSARGRRGSVWLALALAAAVIAAVLTMRAAVRPEERATLVVATSDLPPGLLIDEASVDAALMVVPVAASATALPGLLADPRQALGRRLAVPVGIGEPVTQAALGGAPGVGPGPLAVGERAVAVPLSAAGGAAAGLAAGARVDVVASTGEGPAGRTAVVVGDAEVLAVAQAPAVDGAPEAAGEALLRVTAEQALRITAALNFAREVRLLVRPRDETGNAGPDAVAAP